MNLLLRVVPDRVLCGSAGPELGDVVKDDLIPVIFQPWSAGL